MIQSGLIIYKNYIELGQLPGWNNVIDVYLQLLYTDRILIRYQSHFSIINVETVKTMTIYRLA